MRFFRQLIGDGFCGGPAAAVIAVLLALQALIGGFGTGAMALAAVDTASICSTQDADHGAMHVGATSDHGQPSHTKHSKDCCLTACQVAASVHAGIFSKTPQPAQPVAEWSAPRVVVAEAPKPPRQLGLSGDARGPPVLPI